MTNACGVKHPNLDIFCEISPENHSGPHACGWLDDEFGKRWTYEWEIHSYNLPKEIEELEEFETPPDTEPKQ